WYTLLYIFHLLVLPPPRSTLFPYTTLFRSLRKPVGQGGELFIVRAFGFQRVPGPGQQARHVGLVGHDVVGRQALMRGFGRGSQRSEEHTSELQSRENLVCRLLLEKKNKNQR